MGKRVKGRRIVKSDSSHVRSSTEEKLIAATKLIQEHEAKIANLGKLIGRCLAIVQSQEANFKALAGGIDGLDRNMMASAEMLKEVFGQLTQVDEYLKLLDPKTDGKTLDERIDTDLVKATASSWYKEVMASAFEAAQKKIAEHHARQAELQRAEAQKQAEISAEQKERETIEEALTQEKAPLAAPAPRESHIPEGAQIFGG